MSQAEPEAETKAEMHQPVTADTLKAMGLTDEQVAILQGIKTGNTANMEAGLFSGGIGSTLDKVTGMEIMGIPLGQAAVGGALAILLDRIVIAKLDPTNKWGSWANLALALVVKKWGSKFIGNKTADAAALILTYEAVADWVTMGINKVWPTATSKQVFNQPTGGAMHQFNRVANDYYASILGR